MKTIQDKRFLVALLLIAVGVILRVLQWTPNFSPVTAIALFGGARLLDKKLSIIIPLVSLLISDILLAAMNHYPVIHDTIFFVYGSYVLIAVMGWALQEGKFSFLRVGGYAVAASVLFFLLSNFGVWIVGTLYPRTLDGLVTCFTLAIPFFKFTFLGDLVYTFIFFGIYNILFSTDKKLSPESSPR